MPAPAQALLQHVILTASPTHKSKSSRVRRVEGRSIKSREDRWGVKVAPIIYPPLTTSIKGGVYDVRTLGRLGSLPLGGPLPSSRAQARTCYARTHRSLRRLADQAQAWSKVKGQTFSGFARFAPRDIHRSANRTVDHKNPVQPFNASSIVIPLLCMRLYSAE